LPQIKRQVRGFLLLWRNNGKRLGFVGIIIEDRENVSPGINKVLSDFGDIIVARTGVPYKEKECCVITLIVDATTNQIDALTGKLGSTKNVSVKSALSGLSKR